MRDPDTRQDWIPVACPDGPRILVHVKLVLDCGADPARPSHNARVPKTPDVVREMVTRGICRVAMLADPPYARWAEVGMMLEKLLTALSPMRGTMRALAKADPSGVLADVVMSMTEAGWHVGEGDVRSTRTAIAAGTSALCRYLTAD